MLNTLRTLDYVVLLCGDLPRMRSFYQQTLGFPIGRAWDDWVEMRVGAVRLTLRPRGRPYDGPGAPGSAGVQLAFRVPEPAVDGCHRELVARGVEILEEPRSWDYGHRTLFFRDPEGNVLEIYAEITPDSQGR